MGRAAITTLKRLEHGEAIFRMTAPEQETLWLRASYRKRVALSTQCVGGTKDNSSGSPATITVPGPSSPDLGLEGVHVVDSGRMIVKQHHSPNKRTASSHRIQPTQGIKMLCLPQKAGQSPKNVEAKRNRRFIAQKGSQQLFRTSIRSTRLIQPSVHIKIGRRACFLRPRGLLS